MDGPSSQMQRRKDEIHHAVLRGEHPFPQRADDEAGEHPGRQQQAAQEMRAGEGLGEEQRGQKPQRYLAHYIDAHEHQRVHEHFAERGIGDDFAEIIQPDERTQKLSQVAERDLLETHRDVVEDRKPDQREQIEHRREQEDVQQRRSCDAPSRPCRRYR